MNLFLLGVAVGAVLGVVVAALLWATGRRPYLLVERVTTETATRHLVEHVHRIDPSQPALPTLAVHPAARAADRAVPRRALTEAPRAEVTQ